MEPHVELALWLDTMPDAGAPERVAQLERRYGIHLPDDFRLYLLNAAPAEERTDAAGFTWWPVDRIQNIPDECGGDLTARQANPQIEAEANRYLVFADYLIWSYAWAICCSDSENRGKVALISERDMFVADSFSQFVELALADSLVIHNGPSA